MPATIDLHSPLKGTAIAVLFATAAIDLQQHCNTDGMARRYRSNVPLAALFWALAALFWALAAVLARRNSPFFLQGVFTTQPTIFLNSCPMMDFSLTNLQQHTEKYQFLLSQNIFKLRYTGALKKMKMFMQTFHITL